MKSGIVAGAILAIVIASTGMAEPDFGGGDFVEVGEAYDFSGDWSLKSHDISNFEGEVVCLAFVQEGSDTHSWFIDDILVTSNAGTHIDESFEGEQFPPPGWSIYELGDDPHRQWERTEASSNTEPAAARHNYTFGSNHDLNWLVSPPFTLGENASLSYYDRMTFVSWYTYSGVWISVDGCDPTERPVMGVSPEMLLVGQLPDQVETRELVIENAGDATLEWTIDMAEPAVASPYGAADEDINDIAVAAADQPGRSGVDVVGATGLQPGPASGNTPVRGTFDCDSADGLIIHDDGEIDNGYSGNPSLVDDAIFLQLYESVDPVRLDTLCLAFVSQGTDSLDFEVVLYDVDGPDGAPGTQLASFAVTATDIPEWPESEPNWQVVDLSGLDWILEPGPIYIGVRFNPPQPNVFIGGDENDETEQQVGYWWNDDDDQWMPLQSSFPAYRALFMRPHLSPLSCSSPSEVPWLSVNPEQGITEVGESSSVEVTFDSTGLALGTYEAVLCIESNDPDRQPVMEVPVTLHVHEDEVFEDRFESVVR